MTVRRETVHWVPPTWSVWRPCEVLLRPWHAWHAMCPGFVEALEDLGIMDDTGLQAYKGLFAEFDLDHDGYLHIVEFVQVHIRGQGSGCGDWQWMLLFQGSGCEAQWM